MEQPHDTTGWREIDWSKGSSQHDGSLDSREVDSPEHADLFAAAGYLADDETDPFHDPIPTGSNLGARDSSRVSSDVGKYSELPKAKINVPPEKIQIGTARKPKANAEGSQQLKPDRKDREKDTDIPFGFYLHPDRPWTKDEMQNLCDIIDGGERDFAKISRQMQRTEDQCHRKYLFQACLEVKEPRIGEWSAEQDAMLARFIEEYKITDWDRIAFHCGTTNAEARRHWASRGLTKSTLQSKRSQSEANTNLTVNSATSGAMMTALDNMLGFDDNTNTSTSPTPLATMVRSSSDGSEDDEPLAATSVIAKTERFGGKATATVQETKAQVETFPTLGPGRKRVHAEVDDDEISSHQPEPKARRTRNSKTASLPRMVRPTHAQQLRRSSRRGRGERTFADDYLWYDHDKIKSLSKKGLKDDTTIKQSALRPTTNDSELESKRAIKVHESRDGGKTRRTANTNRRAGKAPIPKKHRGGKPHTDAPVETADEIRIGRRQTGRTGLLQAGPESSRTISAAQEDTTLFPSQGASGQKLRSVQILSAVSAFALETDGKGRKRARETQPEEAAREEGPAKRAKKGNMQIAPALDAGRQARVVPEDSIADTVPPSKTVDNRRKPMREAEEEVEDNSPRKLRSATSRQTGRLRSASDSQEAVPMVPDAPVDVETPGMNHASASEDAVPESRPRMQLRKPRHRAGIDRRAGNYPRNRPMHM